jgi:hypothetical protein
MNVRVHSGCLLLALVLVGPEGARAGDEGYPKQHQQLKHRLKLAAIRFFRENAHPASGLVHVSANNFKPVDPKDDRASISTTGYAIAVFTNAYVQGLMERQEAEDYTLKTLRFLKKNHDSMTHRGWFLHFVRWDTGSNYKNKSEYATSDTANFIAGALYAGQVFGGEIKEIADELYGAIDFEAMRTNGGECPGKMTLSLSYRKEDGPGKGKKKGYSPSQWDHFAQEVLLLILGLGHPKYRLPKESWVAFRRQAIRPLDSKVIVGFDRALFTQQYSEIYLDLRHFQDGRVNYFENARLASLLNRDICLGARKYPTYAAGYWGLSAGSGPPRDQHSQGRYVVNTPTRYNGVACIGAAAASAMYLPGLVMGDLQRWVDGPHRTWGRYGLADGIEVHDDGTAWVAPDVHGITVGPMFMALANISEETSVWKDFNRIPWVKAGLEAASKADPPAPAIEGALVPVIELVPAPSGKQGPTPGANDEAEVDPDLCD